MRRVRWTPGCPPARLAARPAVRLPVLLAALLSAGCGGGLLTEMGRTLGDPLEDPPVVSSFAAENRIEVSWPQDANADQFILQRAADAAVPSFSTVYSGSGTAYSDTDCADQERYLYRLTRTRGTRSFGPSELVMGVASAVCRDALEPNDEEGRATDLAATAAANLYYYVSAAQGGSGSLVQQDVDWYSVTVPPHRRANIVVTQDNLLGGSVNTWMYFYLKGSSPVQIVNNQAVAVTNWSDTSSATLRFKIYPIPSSFAVAAGGSLITYTVSLNSITSF